MTDQAPNYDSSQSSRRVVRKVRRPRAALWSRSLPGGKTLWDWVNLLLAPLVVVIIMIVALQTLAAREQANATALEEQAALLDEVVAETGLLQSYIDEMSALMGNDDFPSLVARPLCLTPMVMRGESAEVESVEDMTSAESVTVGRDSTAAAYDELTDERLASLIRYTSNNQLFDLYFDCELESLTLTDADLSGVNFANVDLTEADLSGSQFHRADLSLATLTSADLSGAEFFTATLDRANMQMADLSGASISTSSTLTGADLSNSDLSNATITLATLRDVNLAFANLNGATIELSNLRGVDLTEADLTDVTFGDEVEIDATTILPDGTPASSTTDVDGFMARFTDTLHPDYWRSVDCDSPAYDSAADPSSCG